MRIASGPALPVGVESEAEFLDIEVDGEIDIRETVSKINLYLPRGLVFIDGNFLHGTLSIAAASEASLYEVRVNAVLADIAAVKECFDKAAAVPFKRIRGDKRLAVDLKDYISHLAVADNGVLSLTVKNVQPMLKISEIVFGLFGLVDAELKVEYIVKRAVNWKHDS